MPFRVLASSPRTMHVRGSLYFGLSLLGATFSSALVLTKLAETRAQTPQKMVDVMFYLEKVQQN